MGCRILIAVEFDKSARSLLARATYLALSQHDAQVDIGHILSSSSESARQSEELSEQAHWLELQAREAHHPVEVRDIPFSPSALRALSLSAELCLDAIGEVEVLFACRGADEMRPQPASDRGAYDDDRARAGSLFLDSDDRL